MRNIFRIYDRGRLVFTMLAIKLLKKKKYPFYVNLVINSNCNLKCAYCFGNYPKRKNPDMSFDEFKEIIDILHSQKTIFICIQGGEPLLHRDLGRFLGYLHEKKIISSISTNGQFPSKIKEIPELDFLDNISFSLDGNKTGNDKVRGNGVFDKVMESIVETQRRYSVPIRIKTTVHKYVKNDAAFMSELVRKYNVDWGIDFLFNNPLNENNDLENDMSLSDSEVKEYLSEIRRLQKCGCPLYVSRKVFKYSSEWPVSYNQRFLTKADAANFPQFKPIECQYGNYEIVIDEDKKIYPCQAMQGIFDAKSIANEGFTAAFAELDKKPCYTCYMPTLINTSAMINWDLSVIGEIALNTIFSRVKSLIFSPRYKS